MLNDYSKMLHLTGGEGSAVSVCYVVCRSQPSDQSGRTDYQSD